MKLFFLFVVGCALIIQFSSIHATNLNEYLNEKLRQSKIEFIKIHIQETSPVHEKLYKVQWNKSWRVPLTSEHRPFTINIFDEIFILDDNRVMAPSLNQTSWNKTYLALHQVDWIGELSPVKFVRNIVWEDTTYLLLCYEPDLCSLYTATRNNTLRFRHTIGHRGIPVDAKFFTQDDQLHLVIANNAGKFSVPSIIYRWSGTYMDVVDEVMTIGAISVTAFEQRRSTIIVFAQYEAENPRVGSEVYEFKVGDIERIQFLSITRPISMHHYVHGDFNFVLMTNELGRSNVLCWDGQELLHWFSLSGIEPHSLMSIFHVDGNTFIVVAHDNIIQLYKFHSTSDWKSENVKQFEDDQKIIDMVVSMNKYTMNVILIIEEKNVYLVEQWQAEMTSVPSENIVEDTDATRKCLSDLIETLQARMPAIKEAEASWKILLPSAKNLTITEPVKFDNLNFQHGTVDSIEITAEEDILPPHLIEDVLNELDHNIDEIAAGSKAQKEMIITNVEMWQDEIVIDDAYLEELEIDRVDIDIVNDAEMLSEKVILPKGNQNFTHPLRVENIIVHELEVESLCGVPSQYWMLRKDEGITFTAANSSIEYSNDTIIVHSDLTVPRLKIKSLNGTIVDELIDNLFLINHTQKIKGTITYKNFLDITNLTTQMLNGIPADKFMTTRTNQTFDDFYIPVLKIDNLFAETVNGIPIEEAARKSRKNIIKGKLKLANLHVTENFTIDVNTSMMQMFNERFLHIYENVTIFGNLHLRSIKIENAATLFVEDVPINVNDLFNNFWTKSGDQTITEKITLKNGVTIDRLDAKYLNGFTENDFLYTTMEEIPSEFTNLRFENLYVDEFFNENDYSHDSLFQVESNQLIIRKQLHLQSLRAEDIITLTFNGVDVDDIMNGIRTNFSGTTKLFTVQARRVFVDNLNIDLLNDREVLFEDGLHLNDDHQIATLKTPQFNVRKLEVERLNRIKMDLLTQLKNLTDFDLSRIVIDGDLIVKNLTVRQVDGQSMESFLEELGQSDIMITSEKSIESLIVENITLESLHGQNFDELFANVLSKSREQKISGHFSAHIVTSDNVTMNFINQQNASKFMWIDEPLTITGNVTFSDLFVEGDVITSKLNGRNVRELYDSLLHVPVKNIDFLKVDGNISWETPLTSPTSISYLWKNAVTKTGDQDITGKVTFAKDVHAWTVIGAYNEINEIERIISDAVINDGENIEISGKKFFENDFIADKLVVNGDLGIAKVNDVDILKFNDSAVRRNREETILGPLTFLKDVTIEKLHVNDADFNASINAVVRTNDVMPDNVFFEDLVVMNDVHLKNLNGIDFDEFVSNRVTLTGNHSISCDLKFNGVVTVTGNAHIGKINGIYPSEFVLNDVDEVQMIYGTKTFEDDLIVEGNVTAPQINGVDIIKEFNNGVQNDEDVNIFGNLIFKANVRIQNMNVSGLVNGVNFRSAISDSQEKANKTRQSLEESWKIIEQNIEYSSEMFENLGNIFFYLEIEENLKIPGNNVSKIDVVHFNEDEIRLNMYSEQPGIFCGLPDHCLCVYQSVVEIIDGNVRKWQVYPGEIVRNFHDPNSVFGINVITNAVSSNEKCTSSRTKQEFTTISLMKSENSKKIHEDVFDKIEGYLKDASIFKHDGNVYIILAIYYDKVSATHRTNSLLYKVHMEKRNATLVQEIPTDGAWSIQIFKINEEVFLLIGCFGESSESSLYRFNLLTQKFEQLRTFASRSRYVKSLSQGKDHFVLLDNPDTNAVNIYKYDPTSRNFHNYQNIFHVHRINGIECFYADDFGNSDVFVIVTTQGGRFYIYEYMFAGKFQMKLQHAVDDLRTMMPFYYMDRHYILIGTDNDNIIFRIVKQGPH
ncbi:uncharacterized protein LOC114929196 [Nylanderia fulva]|uniref:uncharacterized protein LOC114929196 n=1 Tax=Nylanderia fulva TaxID=613905 RepID=UPI0010FB3028|nr:uncharacterized protein LOC114929196 [Nylanderia fulva]